MRPFNVSLRNYESLKRFLLSIFYYYFEKRCCVLPRCWSHLLTTQFILITKISIFRQFLQSLQTCLMIALSFSTVFRWPRKTFRYPKRQRFRAVMPGDLAGHSKSSFLKIEGLETFVLNIEYKYWQCVVLLRPVDTKPYLWSYPQNFVLNFWITKICTYTCSFTRYSARCPQYARLCKICTIK